MGAPTTGWDLLGHCGVLHNVVSIKLSDDNIELLPEWASSRPKFLTNLT